MEYTYDETGRLKTFDNGFGATTYEYDLLDRVTRVIDHNGNATVYEYDALGNRSAVRYPNGTVMTYTYDVCQRLKEECVTDANGTLLSKYTYGLGKAGERLTITEETDGTTTEISYTYDSLNRLVKETITREENELTNEYTYDKVSNRISKTTTVTGELSALADTDLEEIEIIEGTTTYTYNALNQLVTETTPEGTTTYTYDGNGNLIQKSGRENAAYTYDVENHLLAVEVKKEDGITKESYTYDYAGNRTSKTVEEGENKDTTYYVTETSGSLSQVVAETDEEGKVTAFYTLGEDLISMERGEETWYYIYDGHGSVRHLADSNGSLTDSYTYDAYGNLLEKEGTTENDFLYAGEQYNAGTGLYYLRARYMDPSTGTFISMDSYQGSIYDPVSLHKYLYANANPVTYVDPSGYNSNTLVAQMITLDIKCRLITQAYQVAFKTLIGMVVGGALGAIDSYLGGNDLQQIQEDAVKGALLGGAFGGGASIFAGFVKSYPKLKVLLKIEPIAGVILGYFGIKDSLDNGHGGQAIFRAVLTLPSIIGSAGVLKDIKLPKFGSKSAKSTEVYYRTMSQSDYDYLRMTGELPATGETFISPTKAFSSDYDGVMVRFELNNGTTSMLEKIGLSNGDRAMLAREIYPDMDFVSGIKWTENFAFFKAEGSQINIGLGKGKALEIFNSNISTFEKVEY